MSALGREMVVSIVRRISMRASRLCASVALMISSLMPLIFRSSWMPVMPFCVPAILKSMSPKWSSSPMMSVNKVNLSPSFTSPTEMPATGLVIGTPAAISPKVAPQTLAIELEPFDSRMSEITRIV